MHNRGELIAGDVQQLLKRHGGGLSGGAAVQRGSSGAGCQNKAQSGEHTDEFFHVSSSCFQVFVFVSF